MTPFERGLARATHARGDVPTPFRVMALEPAYAADVWAAVKRAFSDNHLSRRLFIFPHMTFLDLYLVEKFWGAAARGRIAAQMEYRA